MTGVLPVAGTARFLYLISITHRFIRSPREAGKSEVMGNGPVCLDIGKGRRRIYLPALGHRELPSNRYYFGEDIAEVKADLNATCVGSYADWPLIHRTHQSLNPIKHDKEIA